MQRIVRGFMQTNPRRVLHRSQRNSDCEDASMKPLLKEPDKS
jgi:hypothetical protein